jgi:hypothetical protein
VVTEDEVCSLFADYAKARDVSLDPLIVKDIYAQTRGHAGSVGFMGRFIDNVLFPTSYPDIGYDAWVCAGTRMRRELADSPNMKKPVNELRSPEDSFSEVEAKKLQLVLSARRLLVTILHSCERS